MYKLAPSCVISRFIEDMVAMASDALTTEQLWEAEALWHIRLRDKVVATFRLVHHELADLQASSMSSPSRTTYM